MGSVGFSKAASLIPRLYHQNPKDAPPRCYNCFIIGRPGTWPISRSELTCSQYLGAIGFCGGH